MKKFLLLSAFLALAALTVFQSGQNNIENKLVTYTVNLSSQYIILYYKDANNQRIGSLKNLKTHLEKSGHKLAFAMNGGMFQKDFSPLGLYIENGKEIQELNTRDAGGNFYLKPNGVFYITKNKKANICITADFKADANIKYATQSGPMLVIDSKIHDAFKEGSDNVNIRNGVGILPNGNVLFAMSKEKVNFYDFAKYFKDKGCKNALYLDGFVSRAYAPSQKWEQLDGEFGVMIGVVE